VATSRVGGRQGARVASEAGDHREAWVVASRDPGDQVVALRRQCGSSEQRRHWSSSPKLRKCLNPSPKTQKMVVSKFVYFHRLIDEYRQVVPR
jgi:hypothetical protein